MTISNLLSETTSGFSKCKNTKVAIPANLLTNVLPENPKRAYATLFNLSNVPISVVLGDTDVSTSDPEQGIILLGKGSFYEIKQENLFQGRIRAISAVATQLLVTEGSSQ